jgi:hypothetical protein
MDCHDRANGGEATSRWLAVFPPPVIVAPIPGYGCAVLVAQFEPSVRHDDLCLEQLCPAVALVWGSQMSTLQRRLSGFIDTIAALNAQIRELDQARDLVRKARLSARRARRKSRRKRRAF